MRVQVFADEQQLAEAAAAHAATAIRKTLARQGAASIVAATGTSQLKMLDLLVREPLDWSKTVFFHLDEYLGLPRTHPASFRRYLESNIVDRVRPRQFHFIRGDCPDPAAECTRLAHLLAGYQLDLALVGIGENGHLAFNDPPADLKTTDPFLVVELDEACRRQQLGEGWFQTLDEVPRRAITMSVHQILQARSIVATVPGRRKAKAVQDCLEGKVSPWHPASALRRHSGCVLLLDRDSASLLSSYPNDIKH